MVFALVTLHWYLCVPESFYWLPSWPHHEPLDPFGYLSVMYYISYKIYFLARCCQWAFISRWTPLIIIVKYGPGLTVPMGFDIILKSGNKWDLYSTWLGIKTASHLKQNCYSKMGSRNLEQFWIITCYLFQNSISETHKNQSLPTHLN